MFALGAFLLSLLLISVLGIRYRIPPFLLLVGAALFYGLVAGVPLDQIVPALTQGAGRVFAILGIVIFSGAVIGSVYEGGGYLEHMVRDLRRISGRPRDSVLLLGYLLAIPLMCCMTAYIVLHPLVSCLHKEDRKNLLYLTAFGSVISYVLIYPSPVLVGTLQTLAVLPQNPYQVDLFTIPLSLGILGLSYLALRRFPAPSLPAEPACALEGGPHRLILWAPVLVIVAVVLTGLAVPFLSLLSNVNIALLAGMATALALTTGSVRTSALSVGTKRAGIIIFDLVGAGAFGGVIGASAFSTQLFETVVPRIPLALVPFIIAALLQTAQGSRTITALITAEILAASGLVSRFHPYSLVLMIAAGTLIVSYMSDPYFWLIQRTTGDEPRDVIRKYTLPLGLAGGILLLTALIL